MLKLLTKFILGGGVEAITDSIRTMRKDALDASNASKRVELEKTIAVLDSRREVMVAEAKSNWNVVFRMVLALPFAVFIWKVVVYDKVLGLGATDNISPDLWNLMMLVYGFYFVYETASLFKRN